MTKNQQHRIIIKVINNGSLIPPGLLDKIFVPVAVSSEENQTAFILEF
jgi:nitrogen-specific signal transduction histidine kinase